MEAFLRRLHNPPTWCGFQRFYCTNKSNRRFCFSKQTWNSQFVLTHFPQLLFEIPKSLIMYLKANLKKNHLSVSVLSTVASSAGTMWGMELRKKTLVDSHWHQSLWGPLIATSIFCFHSPQFLFISMIYHSLESLCQATYILVFFTNSAFNILDK